MSGFDTNNFGYRKNAIHDYVYNLTFVGCEQHSLNPEVIDFPTYLNPKSSVVAGPISTVSLNGGVTAGRLHQPTYGSVGSLPRR